MARRVGMAAWQTSTGVHRGSTAVSRIVAGGLVWHFGYHGQNVCLRRMMKLIRVWGAADNEDLSEIRQEEHIHLSARGFRIRAQWRRKWLTAKTVSECC